MPDGESHRRRLPPDERRAHLLDVALSLAAGGDVAAISVSELAAAAGVSEGLLYHYFPTKQALVEAALRRAAESFMADLEQAASSGDPLTLLSAGLSAYLDTVEANPVGWKALLRATSGELAAIVSEVTDHTRALALRSLQIDEPGPGLEVALSGWQAFEREACATWLERRHLPREAMEQMLADAFLTALTTAARYDETAAAALQRLGLQML
jgi:AcrR family transcriptional regulator